VEKAPLKSSSKDATMVKLDPEVNPALDENGYQSE
jgi:hypothetical protein